MEYRGNIDNSTRASRLSDIKLRTRGIWLLVYLLATTILVELDQATKAIAYVRLHKTDYPIISGVLEFSYLENTGAAWGMLRGQRVFFIILTIVVVLAVTYMMIKMPVDKKKDMKASGLEADTAKMSNNKAGDTVAGDTKSSDMMSSDIKSGDTKAGDTKAGATVVGETVAGDTKAGDTIAGDTKACERSSGRRYIYLRIVCILLVSGAIGNFIDRLKFGYVRDFIYFKLINFPVFNVADCYVTVSVFLFAVLMLFYYKDEDFKFLKP